MSTTDQANTTSGAAVAAPVDQPVRPRAWWRLSIFHPHGDPCVTVHEEEAEFWRSQGLTVIELGDAAAARKRCAKLLDTLTMVHDWAALAADMGDVLGQKIQMACAEALGPNAELSRARDGA